jgi:hypothetical protein
MATAGAAPDLTVADQIDLYLKTSPALETEPADALAGIVGRQERKIHGEVSVGVGTGGYRSLYARADMPVGETGRLSIAVQETRGRFGHGWGRFYDRQRCDLEAMSPGRPLDLSGGPHGRCVGPVPLR